MIRVLNILSTVTGGGVERRRLSLAKYLDKNKFEMKLVGTFKSGSIAERIEEQGVEIIEVGDFKGPFHWEKHKKVQKIIDDFKPHIIHGAVFEGVTMAAINGWIKNVPIIIIEETSDPQNRSWKAHILIKLFSLVSDKAVAIAPNVANYLTKTAKINTRKVITINNGVEVPRAVSVDEVEELKIKWNIREEDFIVGSVGRLENQVKKFTDIIEALSYIPNKNVKLLIVGGGADEELIIDYANKLGVLDRLIMVGYQYDTALYYKLMDLFCIVSSREGFGLVAAEAMLHQLAVIATKVGGLQNVVVDGQTGYLVPVNSPSEIAKKIIKLIDNNEIRLKLGQRGYIRALENYTEEKYVKEVEALYLNLLLEKNINFS